MLEHARGRAVRTHGTRLSVDRADAVGFLQTVLIPSLDDARISVTLGNTGCIHFVACRKDVRLHFVADLIAFGALDAHFAQILAGSNARLLELTEIGLVERLLLCGKEPELQCRVSVRLRRLDLHHGAGTCLDDRDGNDLPVLRKNLGHTHFAADDCFTHRKVHSFSLFSDTFFEVSDITT